MPARIFDPTTSPSLKRMARARAWAIPPRPALSVTFLERSDRTLCRSARSKRTSVIPKPPPASPACSKPCWHWSDLLPASLHFDEPNPDIAFADLNLTVAGAAIPLERRNGTRFAGVSSFGFGGTNAHVILADAPKPAPTDVTDKPA